MRKNSQIPLSQNPKSCQVHRQLKVVRGKIPEVKPLADDVVNLREEVSRDKKTPAAGDVGCCSFFGSIQNGWQWVYLLGGGFKYFIFSTLFGEDSHVD